MEDQRQNKLPSPQIGLKDIDSNEKETIPLTQNPPIHSISTTCVP